MGASTGCEPACELGQVCVAYSSGPGCADSCGSNSECVTDCCANLTSGGRVCAESRYCQSGGTTEGCTDRTSCIQKVSAVAGNLCGDSASLDVTVRNGCSQSIGIKICIRKSDGSCYCGMNDEVRPGGTVNFWGCNTANQYTVIGRAVEDFAKGCYPDQC